jgi:hypothetical protein
VYLPTSCAGFETHDKKQQTYRAFDVSEARAQGFGRGDDATTTSTSSSHNFSKGPLDAQVGPTTLSAFIVDTANARNQLTGSFDMIRRVVS